MTDNLIQQARTYTKNQIFGDAKENAGYARIHPKFMKDMGQIIMLDMCD